MDDSMSLFNFKAWLGLVFLVLVLASGLFIPAGTFDYWQAWVFLSVFTLAPSLWSRHWIIALPGRRWARQGC
jgi:hypothetical protein